jgi:hypothetical protein
MSYFETGRSRIAFPLLTIDFFRKVRTVFVAIFLILTLVYWPFEQTKKFVDDFESSVSGLMQVLNSDVPQPPKAMLPKPPSFAFDKGFGPIPSSMTPNFTRCRIPQ